MTQVNRYLANKDMDRIDHALGRPVDPMAETHRNHYAIDLDHDLATRMAADPCWHMGQVSGGMAFFHVTTHGRRTLKTHLRDIGDAYRLYDVSFDNYPLPSIAATSHAKARYAAYLDADLDMPFGEFCKRSRVTLSLQGIRS
jgi:hypothetical protein